MNKLIKFFMKLMGEKMRHRIYRKRVYISDSMMSADFTIEIAQSAEDLEEAYRLLHNCYVGINIISPQPSGLRCNLFSFLPTTTTIVAKLKGKVVGTVSLIKNSGQGLPSDQQFLSENNEFRRKHKTLIEASALAVAPEYRSPQHGVSLLLMKYLYNYSKHWFQGDHIVAAVHPKSEDFYKALFHFQKNSGTLEYDSLKGALAIHMTLGLSDEHEKSASDSYGTQDPRRNILAFFAADDARFRFPRQKAGQSIFPVITPAQLKHFCLEHSEVWSRLSEKEKGAILQVYSTYFGQHSVQELGAAKSQYSAEKDYRTPIKLSSVVKVNSSDIICEILDLSDGGCFIKWSGEFPNLDERLNLTFRMENKVYRIAAQVAWRNDNENLNYQRGIGIRFEKPIVGLNMQLSYWLYGELSVEFAEKKAA